MDLTLFVDDERVTDRATSQTRTGNARLSVAVLEIAGFGSVAHVAADGATPGAVHLMAVAAVATLAAFALRHRLVGLPVAVAGVVGAQVAIHAMLTAGAGHAAHAGSGLDSTMLLAHGASAVVTALALTWQEQVLVGLARSLSTDVLGVVMSPAFADPTGSDVPPRELIGMILGTASPRRGPPVATLSA